MKHTIKIDAGKAIVIQRNKKGPGVQLSLELFGASMASAILTPDQCGALIFGLEESNEKESGVRCHGDGCAAGQIACPTPNACRVSA